MNRLLCPLRRLLLSLRLDDCRGPSPAFLRHRRVCPACAAFQFRQEALLVSMRRASGTLGVPAPDPALTTRILALARAREDCTGVALRRRHAAVALLAGFAAVAAIATLVLLADRRLPPASAQACVPEPIPAFVWAEVVLRGDLLQTEWERLAEETRRLAAGLAEEVRLTLL